MGGDTRGQTLQDFTIGISLFLLTVAFVLTLFPSYLDPFTAGANGGDEMRANRLSQQLIAEHAVAGNENVLNASRLAETLSLNQSALQERYGLPRQAAINVSVRPIGGERVVRHEGSPLATDLSARGQAVAARSRIVEFRNGTLCRPGCEMVVRVW